MSSLQLLGEIALGADPFPLKPASEVLEAVDESPLDRAIDFLAPQL